jgi:hypothetical protein
MMLMMTVRWNFESSLSSPPKIFTKNTSKPFIHLLHLFIYEDNPYASLALFSFSVRRVASIAGVKFGKKSDVIRCRIH